MIVQIFITEQEKEQIKKLSLDFYGKENVSGYIVRNLRSHLHTGEPKPTFKTLIPSMQTDNVPKWQTDAAQRIKRKPTPPAAKKTKHLTPQQLQTLADNTMK